MRPCDFCVGREYLYVVSSEFPHCERYIRANRTCELALPDAELDRLYKQDLKLREARAELAAKKARLRKQQLII
jgi:hypothetical protein